MEFQSAFQGFFDPLLVGLIIGLKTLKIFLLHIILWFEQFFVVRILQASKLLTKSSHLINSMGLFVRFDFCFFSIKNCSIMYWLNEAYFCFVVVVAAVDSFNKFPSKLYYIYIFFSFFLCFFVFYTLNLSIGNI